MKISRHTILVLFLFLSAWFVFGKSKELGYRNIEPQQVKAEMDSSKDIVLLDVRTKEEYNGPLGHLTGAILVPVQDLEDKVSDLKKYKDKELIVYCRSGNRSVMASKILVKEDFKNVNNMVGGMRKWNELYGDPQEDQKN